jgi:predicted PurR-regulated permease PerM
MERSRVQFQYHANLTLGALRRWLIAQLCDSLLVGALWLAVLSALQVPLPWLWALVAAGLHWLPLFGPLLALPGPAMAMLHTGAPLERWIGLLGGYAAIYIVDGFLLQPLLMRKANRTPVWASLLTPLLLGILFPFWGALLAPPLLAMIYAWRHAPKPQPPHVGEQQFSHDDPGILLPPEEPRRRDHSGRP